MKKPETDLSNHANLRLDGLRSEIDDIDRKILALVVGRTTLALEISDTKRELDLPTMVSGRHTEVIDNYRDNLPEDGPLTPEDAVALCETVMKISRNAQDRRRAETVELHEVIPSGVAEPLPDTTQQA